MNDKQNIFPIYINFFFLLFIYKLFQVGLMFLNSLFTYERNFFATYKITTWNSYVIEILIPFLFRKIF